MLFPNLTPFITTLIIATHDLELNSSIALILPIKYSNFD
jgi:hypothetical protein